MIQKLRPWKTILTIELNSNKTAYQQIAESIVEEIKRGRLQPGTPLPGTRQLAEDLNINRKVIVQAYEDLTAEGWLVSRYKKGTFVADQLPALPKKPHQIREEKKINSFSFNQNEEILFFSGSGGKKGIVFDDGLPDVRLAPMNDLANAYKRIFQQNTRWRMMGYGAPEGGERIRKAIADMLAHDRGLPVKPEQLCITRGSQMALYLTANTLIQKGDMVAVENPGYAPAWKVFTAAGATLYPIKVDEEGMCMEALEKHCSQYKLKAVYTTPHHQFPTTVSMKAERRLRLLELANQYGFAVIEDDYDHEYHFTGKSLLPLASHAEAANVIYISSLSKVVAPAIRIGYIAGPQNFIRSVAALRKLVDMQGDTVMEHAIAELMETGAIRKHSRKAFELYKDRRDNMEQLLKDCLEDQVYFTKPAGGLAYWVKLLKEKNTIELARELQAKGVSVLPTEIFSFEGKPLNALRLGYASLTLEELKEGVQVLQEVLQKT